MQISFSKTSLCIGTESDTLPQKEQTPSDNATQKRGQHQIIARLSPSPNSQDDLPQIVSTIHNHLYRNCCLLCCTL